MDCDQIVIPEGTHPPTPTYLPTHTSGDFVPVGTLRTLQLGVKGVKESNPLDDKSTH